MTDRSTSRRRSRRWERYLSLAADAGAIAMSLRDRPTRLDWMALGARAVGLVLRVRAEHRRIQSRDPWTFFDTTGSDRTWLAIPDEFQPIVLHHVGEVDLEPDHWDGEPDSHRVYLGTVGGEQIGWVGDRDGEPSSGPYLRAARESETYRALGQRLWAGLGGRQALYGKSGLTVDPLAAQVPAATAQVRALRERIGRFLACGLCRSVLLVGPPGTGKSHAIRYLAHDLGLTCLRVDLAALRRDRGAHVAEEAPVWLETLLRVLAPELLVIDDLDRVDTGGELLHFLELAATTCRLVLASANATDAMLGAALRPGRFDEIVRVDRLDDDLLRDLLGHDADLFDRMSGLPVAYVAEFVKRRQALGRERALAELDELCARRDLVEQQTERGQ